MELKQKAAAAGPRPDDAGETELLSQSRGPDIKADMRGFKPLAWLGQ